jgi:hypothetical protein
MDTLRPVLAIAPCFLDLESALLFRNTPVSHLETPVFCRRLSDVGYYLLVVAFPYPIGEFKTRYYDQSVAKYRLRAGEACACR